MPIELVVPKVGESITEVEIGDWYKKEGEEISVDESLVVIDTAKATVDLPSPIAGRLTKILKQTGEAANVGEIIGYLEEGAGSGSADAGASAPAASAKPAEASEQAPEWKAPVDTAEQPHAEGGAAAADSFVMPAAQRALATNNLSADAVTASGPGGRVLKEDVQAAAAKQSAPSAQPAAPAPAAAKPAAPTVAGQDEEVVPMSLMRRRIAQRLVEAQQTAALLTTFNEIDMSSAMAMRKEHQETFQKRYGIKLGFMSFFVKAAIDSLKQYPAINAEIRGKDIVYKNHYDIGVAIGSGKGLVVPVLRNADRLSFAEIENAIAEFAGRVKDNTLSPEALEGGTFTITNGGIYGSLLSTPIVNPPQSGILGMHTIQERPVAVNGQVVIRPMMYIALTYDHRIVDGREAVSFLKRLKDCVENPARMLIEV